MSLTTECTVCAKAIKETNEKVICFGSCGAIMHLKCCDEIDKAGLKAIETNIGVKYMCHDCRSQQISFNTVMERCNKIIRMLCDCEKKYEKWQTEAGKKEENEKKWKEEVKHQLEQIGNKIALQSKKDNSVEENWQKKKETPVSPAGPSGNLRNKKKKKMEDEMQQLQSPKTSDARMSFADAVKNKTVNEQAPKKNKLPVIVVKPKEVIQSTKATKQALQSQINRKENNISAVREGRDGTIILGIENTEQINTALQTVREKLGEKYHVTVPKPKKPRLKIVGAEDDLDEEGLRETIASQNVYLRELQLRLITKYSSEDAEGSTTYSYIVEVDETSYETMLTARRLYIGWDRCNVFECFGIIRCFKCCAFGHKSTDCQKDEVCAKCTGQHKTAECNSSEVQCANCKEANRIRKLNLSTDHYAFSRECATYKRLVTRRRRQIENDR